MTATSLKSAVQFLTGAIDAGAEGLKGTRSLLEQLASLSEEELGQFGQRIPHVRAVLRRDVPLVEELIRFLTLPFTGLPKPERIEPLKGNWIEQLLRAEKGAWKKLGVEFSPALQSLFMEMLKARGKERVELDRAYGLAHSVLPDLVLTPEWFNQRKLIPPKSWYWDQFKGGQLLWPNGEKIEESRLQAGVYLVDTSSKPQYQDGRQRWQDDLLMEVVIRQCYESGQIPIHEVGGPGTRFFCSRIDYEQFIAPMYSRTLELPESACVRLETVPEWSLLCQYKTGRTWPRAKDGTTDTWIWFHEHYVSSGRSLIGGNSAFDGLRGVVCSDSGGRWNDRSGRLLAVLGTTAESIAE